MKILGIILLVLMLSLSALVGVLAARKAFEAGSELDKITSGLSDAQLDALSKQTAVPSAGRLKAGAAASLVAALAAVGLMVVAFARKRVVPIAAVAAIALAGLAIVLYPYVPTGPLDGLAPRSQAMIAAVMALVGAGGALLVKKASA